jgi:hypothetical protein
MRKFISIAILASFYCYAVQADANINQTELPEPYKSVQLLDFNGHGFFGNAEPMKNLILENHVKVAIEVGCWLGSMTRYIANLIPENGLVYAVDHWLGSEEHQPGQVFAVPFLSVLYEQFLSNIIHSGLTNKIIPVRMNSVDAAKLLVNIVPDLIYIDASHDYESVYADLQAWYPLVKGHGILCGDDWHHGPIQQAVFTFAKEKGLKVEAVTNQFWRLIELQ